MVMMHVRCYGLRVHPGEIAGTFYVRLLFLLAEFFCLVGTLLFGGGVRFSGIFGLDEPGILAHPTVGWPSRFSMLVGGSLMGIWFWRLRLTSLQYGYQGADSYAEQLALTEQLFDAALGELGAVARDQSCLIVGDFNVEPTKIPSLAGGISAGL